MNTSPNITRKLYNALAVLILMRACCVAARQQALVKFEEEARLRTGGFYIKIDGTPLCCCPTAKIADLSKRSVYAPCWQRELSATVEAVEAIREMNPDCKVTYHAGGCPREE